MEKFLHSDVDKFALSIFVKIRISNSNLNIERGRYIKLPVEKRICPYTTVSLNVYKKYLNNSVIIILHNN
jgi:hypothetical protein